MNAGAPLLQFVPRRPPARSRQLPLVPRKAAKAAKTDARRNVGSG